MDKRDGFHDKCDQLLSMVALAKPLDSSENANVYECKSEISQIIHDIKNTKRNCFKLERKLDSAKTSYDKGCMELFASVCNEKYPSVGMDRLDLVPFIKAKNPLRLSESREDSGISDSICNNFKHYLDRKKGLHPLSMDESEEGACAAKKFVGYVNHQDKYILEYSTCSIVVPGSGICFSLVHTTRKDDKDAKNDQIYFHICTDQFTVRMDAMDKCPLAVVVNSKGLDSVRHNPAKIVLRNDAKPNLFSFEKNPMVLAMVASKQVVNSKEVEEFTSLGSSKRGVLGMHRIKLSDGSVSFMITRKPTLEDYKRAVLERNKNKQLHEARKFP